MWVRPLCCSSAPRPLSPLCLAAATCPCVLCDPHLACPFVCSLPCILSVSFIRLLPLTCTLCRAQGGSERVAAAPPSRLRGSQSGAGSCSKQTEQQCVLSPVSGSTGAGALHTAECGLLILGSLLSLISRCSFLMLAPPGIPGSWLVERGDGSTGAAERQGANPSLQLIAMPSYIQMSWEIVLLYREMNLS